jgi:hypothetical protein
VNDHLPTKAGKSHDAAADDRKFYRPSGIDHSGERKIPLCDELHVAVISNK